MAIKYFKPVEDLHDSAFRIYSIKEDALDGFYSIKNCFSIYASGRDAYTDTTAEPETVTTSSGRVVRRQIYRADEVECDYDVGTVIILLVLFSSQVAWI